MKSSILSICLILTICGVLLSNITVKPVNAKMFHDKATMTQMWKDLCNAYPSVACYESIGRTVEGQDIWLFKFGNPYGGAIMWDGQTHGSEDAGTECGYLFAKWLLESSDPLAKRIMRRNYWLFIPIINVDTEARTNMRRSYTLDNGTIIDVPYGVNLNRNGVTGFGDSGTSEPDSDRAANGDYRGLYGGSEPEIQAIRYAMDKYRPRVYVNTHSGYEFLMYYGQRTTVENRITSLYNNFSSAAGVLPYTIRSASFGGFVVSDAHSFGASAWLWEIVKRENLVDYDSFVAQWYPRVKPMMLAMSEAVGVDGTALIPGDINIDGKVDIADALLLADAWGTSPGDPNWNSKADFNADNVIDIIDANILASHFGEDSAQA